MRPSLRTRVRDVCFAHWPVAPGPLAGHLPEGLAVDARDGRGWVSVLAMRTTAGLVGLPGGLRYGQVNLRTYVRAGDERGVHFLDVDAGSRLAAAAARAIFGVPYHAAAVRVARRDGVVHVRSRRRDGTAFAARFEPSGEPAAPERGSLAHWLTERYRFLQAGDRGGPVAHEPWPLGPADAEVLDGGLLAARGLPDPGGEPVFHYSPGLVVYL